MTLDLADYETGLKYAGDYEADLRAIQQRLEHIQIAFISQRARAIIALEGWDAAGKGGAIRRLAAAWDPHWFQVWGIGPPSPEGMSQHFLQRFWQRLPEPGFITIFDRSWYGRVLVERVEGLCSDAALQRAYDEINEFEVQQQQAGTPIIKVFLHITQEEQDRRLKSRLRDPWKRWKTGPEDYRNRARRSDYLEAYADMFARCDTRWAPWVVIDANSKKAARIAFLRTVADRLAACIDLTPPPLDPELERQAALAFGPGDSQEAGLEG
jgi:polyphosphate kinase 2 (PPK2 family)